jgi:hypothetical protein
MRTTIKIPNQSLQRTAMKLPPLNFVLGVVSKKSAIIKQAVIINTYHGIYKKPENA